MHRRIDKATTIRSRWLLLGHDPPEAGVRLVAEVVSQRWPDTVAVFRPWLAPGARDVALEVVAGRPLITTMREKNRLVPVGRLADASHDHAVTVPGTGHMLPLEAAAGIVPRIEVQVREALTR